MNELTKPQNFEDIVRDKIRKVLFDSIPDEQIDGLIKAQYARLFEARRDQYRGEIPSEFAQMVDAEIKKHVATKITEVVDACFKNQWSEDLSERVLEDVTKKFATAAIAGLAQDLVSGALCNFRNQLANRV